MPDSDIKADVPNTLFRASGPACLAFTVTCRNWDFEVATRVFDALLTHLPMNSVSTLATHNRTRLNRGFWLGHAPRWPLLKRVLLGPTAFLAFRHMLAEDATPADGPRLPLLTNVTLVDVTLTPFKALHLRNMLMKRVEQGVPLEDLDLRTCVAGDRAIQLLREVVVDVQEPLAAGTMPMEKPAFFNWNGGIGYCCNEVEDGYDDERGRYDGPYSDEGEDEDEADANEEEAEYDEFMDYDYGYDYDAVSMF
jgi:hypothetical protein